MTDVRLDLSQVFVLEPHGPDTYVGVSPPYKWGRIYGGLVVAQALWAAVDTVHVDHAVHSLHAYFILGGDPGEPVRYEVDRLRNGRSFTTRQVIARQSGGAILVLTASFQRREEGPETQTATFPDGVPLPDHLPDRDPGNRWTLGAERLQVEVPDDPPRSRVWCRYPESLTDDPRLHACALAYLSDANAMSAVRASHPNGALPEPEWRGAFMTASLDHALWFHRPARADDWMLLDMDGHGLIRTRGLATGLVFGADGTHVATIAQEGLLRERRR